MGFLWRDADAAEWSKEVKARDNYICRVCGKYWISLNSHHMYSWDKFVEYRYDLNNGVTLCTNCHNEFHRIYGKGKNTFYQFLQFEKTYKLIRGALEAKVSKLSSER